MKKQGYKHSVPILPPQFVAFRAFSALQPKHIKRKIKKININHLTIYKINNNLVRTDT